MVSLRGLQELALRDEEVRLNRRKGGEVWGKVILFFIVATKCQLRVKPYLNVCYCFTNCKHYQGFYQMYEESVEGVFYFS